ncbi:MAG: hypothetical protein AAFS06_18175, partial [Cyanobacteria bacterium J06631_12]
QEPLLAFSFVLSTRNNQLSTIANEIIELLDLGISKEFIDGNKVTKAGILVWLWTLGAYEIVRTMCQANICFSSEYIEKLRPLKKKLAKIRMPDSKMEKQGRKQPVSSNRSPWCEVIETKDLLIGDPDEAFSARYIISEYFSIIHSLKREDVIASHEESYK